MFYQILKVFLDFPHRCSVANLTAAFTQFVRLDAHALRVGLSERCQGIL